MSAELKIGAFVDGLRAVDADSLVTGLYLIGSHALGDVHPHSDIDFMGVLRRPPSESELRAIVALHDDLRSSWPLPYLDGCYVLERDLQRASDSVEPILMFLLGDRLDDVASHVLTPDEWITLKTDGVCLFGLPIEQLEVRADVRELRAYCERNLVDYWLGRVDELVKVSSRIEDVLASEAARAWVAERVEWLTLGVPRLLASIETGRVMSKTAAGEYAVERFPEARDVLDASLEYRRDPRPELIAGLIDLVPAAIAFGRECIEAGLAMRGGLRGSVS